MSQRIYKVLTRGQWLRAKAGELVRSPADEADGFVHFSTAEQLQETLDKWFRGEEGCVLLTYEPTAFGADLKWEPARGGRLFPHVYAGVEAGMAISTEELRLGPHGAPLAPERLGADPSASGETAP